MDLSPFSRHLVLPGWGDTGQRRLQAASFLVVGLGGLGTPAALYLARAGVGRLLLNDFDRVDPTNLSRQVLFSSDDIGKRKVTAAQAQLSRHNPDCELELIDHRLQGTELHEVVDAVDVVLDGSDNFASRFAVNAACVATRTPLVSGSAIRYEAQLAVFRPDLDEQPCYRCLYEEQAGVEEDCQGQGVLSPLVGMVGCAMAVEACRVVVGFGENIAGSVLVHDALAGSWKRITLPRDPSCPVCGQPDDNNQHESQSAE